VQQVIRSKYSLVFISPVLVERNLTVLKEKHLSGAAPGKQTIPKPAPSVQKSMNTPPKESGTTDLCPICRKTQLARDCGHRCGFCKVLFCSRCGGKWQVNKQMYIKFGSCVFTGIYSDTVTFSAYRNCFCSSAEERV